MPKKNLFISPAIIKSIICLFIVSCALTAGCNKFKSNSGPENKTETAETAPRDGTEPSVSRDDDPASRDASAEFILPSIAAERAELTILNLPYSPPAAGASLPAYSADAGLTNVENLELFPELTRGLINLLETNLFAVAPSDRQQPSYIYEENEYTLIPSFITTDSVLHLYHMFFSATLASIEQNSLAAVCGELTANMLAEIARLSGETTDPDIKSALRACKIYFAVADILIGSGPDSSGIEYLDIEADLIDRELALIETRGGFTTSPLTGADVFYDSFLPRGHYAKNETLIRYFKTMTWYGTMFYPLSPESNAHNFLKAMVTAYALMSLPKEKGSSLWEAIYEPTSFFVGAADDITPYDVWNAMIETYGENISLDGLSDPAAIEIFAEKIQGYNKSRIVNENSEDGLSAYTGAQFRFMGQRYAPDSEILQRLSKPVLRPVPSGLDMAAVLGAENAELYVREYLKPELPDGFSAGWPDYYDEYKKVKKEFAATDAATWRSNMYYGWLWTISASFARPLPGCPSFMRNEAWYDKQLATGLGSWAELRHDTLLYAKPSGAEKGGWNVEPPKGYVEPNVELYSRLRWLTEYSAESLRRRGLISDYRLDLCRDIVIMLEKLIGISVKELRDETRSEDDYNYMVDYGGTLEWLLIRAVRDDDAYDDIISDRNMAVIADVHNTTFGYLHEAVGLANIIYVIAPADGKLYLTKGAVFDYYELFLNERYTDEMWREWIADDTAEPPARPEWTGSFRIPGY